MKGKIILISGATSGIGYCLLKELHLQNEIIVIGRDINKLKQIEKTYQNIKTYQADLSSLSEVQTVCNTILKDYSTLDILINNAAVQYQANFLDKDFKVENINKEINTNFTSVCILIHKLLPLLKKSTSPSILNVNSGLAIVPKKSAAVYSATKAAIDSLSKTLRNQFEHTNILVQQIFFELVDTSMSKNRGKNKLSSSKAAREVISAIETKVLDYDVGKVKLLRILNKIMPILLFLLLI